MGAGASSFPTTPAAQVAPSATPIAPVAEACYSVGPERLPVAEARPIAPSSLRSITLAPASTFVFLVGICGEWQRGRAQQGDIALYNALVSPTCGVHKQHICHIKDQHGTLSNIKQQLKRMLRCTSPGDTLEIYFGGHGAPQGCATSDGKIWKYAHIIQQIEEEFAGNRAVFLFDTCHAGWLGMHLSSKVRTLRVSYAFIGATQSDSVAGGQWTLTASLIDAIQGRAGLDRDQNGVIDFADFVSYTADRIAKEKKNRISVRIFGDFRPNTVLFTINSGEVPALRRPVWPGEGPSQRMGINDSAFVKYEGGYMQDSIIRKATYIPPNFYPCTVTKLENGRVSQVKARDEFGHVWNLSLDVPNLLPDDYFRDAVRKDKGRLNIGIGTLVPPHLRFRTPNRVVNEMKTTAKAMFREATGSGSVKKRAGNTLVEGTIGAMSIGFAALDAGAETFLQRQRNSALQQTPLLDMMEAHHRRSIQRRREATEQAKELFKGFF